MKKRLLILVSAICSIYSYGQSNCKNCFEGRTFPDSSANKPKLMPKNAVPPNGSGVLGQSYVLQNVCGLNFTTVVQVTETRTKQLNFNTNGSGFPAQLNVNAFCGGSDSILKAYAYWMAEYTENSIPVSSITITSPNANVANYAGTNIGSGASTCWGTTGTADYRADVTAAIAGNGTYNINLTGFNNAGYEVDGVAFVIIYKDPAAKYSGSISLWDGCIVDYTGTPLGPNTYTGFTTCDSSANNSVFDILGDCQNNITPYSVKDKLNNVTNTFGQDFFQMDMINNTPITNAQTSVSATTYTNNTNDCFAWELLGLYWQNTSCIVCTPQVFGNAKVKSFQVNPSCGGGCNGSIGFAVGGGTPPYTYTWSPNVSSTDTATGLCGGTYSCTIQDAGCVPLDTTIVITLPSNTLNVSDTALVNEKCAGNCIGIITSMAGGGHRPYYYTWSPSGGTDSTATGLCAGTYTINVTDINGCTGTATAIITQPAPLTATGAVTNVLCNGGVGTATVTPAGGTSPYTYFWTPSNQITASATGLRAGTYTIKITDNNGCTATTSVVLTQPTLLTASIGTPTYPPCNGGVGSATAAGNGGTSPYTYSWNPTLQITATATGLVARSYTVTVTDNNGCTATTSVVITQPTVVGGSIVVVSYPPCNGNTGSATVTATGGTPGYKYLWTNGETIAAATGMLAGSYTVTITDAHGCTGTVSTTLTQPTALNVTASFTHASCGLNNGTATASPTGGTPTYAYLWSPGGQTNITAINLLAGTYTVKVTDNHNCTASASVTITQPTAVLASISNIVNVSCWGTPTGSATVMGSGGTAPYGYQWSPIGGNGATGTGLIAGKYVVTVTDANGCTVTAGATITQPMALAVTVSGGAIRCLGDQGSFTANATGGTSPYGYLWSPGGQTSMIARLQPPSNITYTVLVTDANGCMANGYISFSFPPPLAVSIAGASVTCSKRSATLCALATGGTGGDTYLWEPVNLSSPCATVPTLVTTIYTVTVEDNCSITATAETTITVNPPPAVDFISNSAEGCAPVCVQFRNLTPSSGGVESYRWSFGNGDSTEGENPLYCYTKSGQYNVTLTVVSDSGCSSTLTKQDMITVYSRPKAAFTYSPQPASILTPTVQFTDESSDAYGLAYQWWSFGDGSDSVSHLADPTHTYRDTGSYCATLIEMNNKGCMDTVTNCLIIEPQYNLYIPSAFTPNGDGLNETFKPVGQYIRSFEMYIFDRWGIQLYHTTDINQGWNGTINGGSISQEDTYIYKITVRDAQDIQHSYIGNVTLVK